jgi:hypothetical protein
MPAVQFPRSTTSEAVTVAISSNVSVLEATIAQTAGWSGGSFGFKRFDQPSMWTRIADSRNTPLGSFKNANPLEDGANYDGHPQTDWAGKSLYDPTPGARRVMFSACGANPSGKSPDNGGYPNPGQRGPDVPLYSYRYQNYSYYDEATNTWACERGVRGEQEKQWGSGQTISSVDLSGGTQITVPGFNGNNQSTLEVRFTSTGTLPAPLLPNTDYQLRRPWGESPYTTYPFEIWTSTFPTLSRITLTNAGSGVHTAWDQPKVAVHLLNTNAIDVAGRRHFKKKFREGDRFLVRSLTTGAWSAVPLSPPLGASGAEFGAFEFIPTRGTSGMLWCWETANGADNGLMRIYEINPTTGASSVILSASNFGSAGGSTSGPMTYNPRAFGGAGGVLVGGQGTQTWKVNCATLAVSSAGQSPTTMGPAYNLAVVRDPIGDGWYAMSVSLRKLYYCNGSSWTEVASLPTEIAADSNVTMVAIDRETPNRYGALWIFGSAVTISGQNNCGGWLYKPN